MRFDVDPIASLFGTLEGRDEWLSIIMIIGVVRAILLNVANHLRLWPRPIPSVVEGEEELKAKIICRGEGIGYLRSVALIIGYVERKSLNEGRLCQFDIAFPVAQGEVSSI